MVRAAGPRLVQVTELTLVLLLVPVPFLIQEMAARLGAVTGVGHARLITARAVQIGLGAD